MQKKISAADIFSMHETNILCMYLVIHMSRDTRKSVFRVCDQVRLKPACAATETR